MSAEKLRNLSGFKQNGYKRHEREKDAGFSDHSFFCRFRGLPLKFITRVPCKKMREKTLLFTPFLSDMEKQGKKLFFGIWKTE
jgi:hypothetical protein